jgi:putative membrane protein
MKNLWMAATLVLGMLAFASCGSDRQDTDTTTNVDPELNATAAADSTLNEDKREFMGKAHSICTQQVELGKLAAEKGLTAQVREYGQQMADLYGNKLNELQEMSGQYGVTLPQQMEDDHAGRVQEMRDKTTEEFDRAYWDTVVDAHKDALDEFEDNVKDIEETDNTTFNLWARNTSKEIRAQMENAMRHRQSARN